MQVKWLIPVFVGAASLFSACGDSPTATSTTAVNLSSTAFATLPPTQSTLPPSTTLPAEGAPSAVAQEYTVVAGDVRVNVAKRFGITLDALDLANVNTAGYAAFFVGLVIKIPEGALVPAPTTTAVPGSDTTAAGDGGTPALTTTVAPDANGCTPGTHTIADGDLPGTVAKKYDVTVAQLDAANVDTKGYKNFVVGAKIVIPCS